MAKPRSSHNRSAPEQWFVDYLFTKSPREIAHFTDPTGKTLPQYAPIQVRVTASIIQSVTGHWQADPASIASVLSGHGLIPSGATLAIDGVANLDKQRNVLT